MSQNIKSSINTFVTNVKNNKKVVAVGTVLMTSAPVFASDATTGTSILDLSSVDFSPVVATVVGVIGVGLVPMLTIAGAKKGVSLLMSLVHKA